MVGKLFGALAKITVFLAIRTAILFTAILVIGFAFYLKINDTRYLKGLVDGPLAERLALAWRDYTAWFFGSDLLGLPVAVIAGFAAFAFTFHRTFLRPGRPGVARPVSEAEQKRTAEIEAGFDAMMAKFEEGREAMRALTADDAFPLGLIADELAEAGDPALEPAILQDARLSIALKRQFPRDFNRTTRSYMGGLPTAQPGLTWPSSVGSDGVRSAFHFAVQIDLADLPHCVLRDHLPATGILYFFLPPIELWNTSDGDATSPLVIQYRKIAEGDWSERLPERSIRPHQAFDFGPQAFSNLHDTAHPGLGRQTVYTRWDLQLGLVVDSGFEPEPPPKPPKDGEARAPHTARSLSNLLADRSVRQFYGPPGGDAPKLGAPNPRALWRPSPRFPDHWLQADTMTAALMNELSASRDKLVGYLAQLDAGEDFKVYGSYARLPAHQAGIANLARSEQRLAEMQRDLGEMPIQAEGRDKAVEAITRAEQGLAIARDTVRRFEAGKRVRAEGQKPDANWRPELVNDIAAHDAALATAAGWQAKAASAGLDAPMPQDQSEGFWDWWQEFADVDGIWFHGLGRLGNVAPVMGLNEITEDALIRAAEACLSYSAATARLVPPDIVAALRPRHEFRPGDQFSQHGRHRMFGWPLSVQTAVEDYVMTHVLLLQLEYDAPMDWRFGDVGVFQYWITPDDLKAGRFDRASLTFEGH